MNKYKLIFSGQVTHKINHEFKEAKEESPQSSTCGVYLTVKHVITQVYKFIEEFRNNLKFVFIHQVFLIHPPIL